MSHFSSFTFAVNYLICLLLPEHYCLECFNIHLHNKSPAIGVSLCKTPLVNNELSDSPQIYTSIQQSAWSTLWHHVHAPANDNCSSSREDGKSRHHIYRGLHSVPSVTLTNTKQALCYYEFHFTDKESETQTGEVTCSRFDGWPGAGPRLEPDLAPRPMLLVTALHCLLRWDPISLFFSCICSFLLLLLLNFIYF